ncbi:uncharacterized protein LOC130898546 [Diorhabda carinulata]|uniref:uncharacterized protein LOC130898546 n=1 Tax=Diorhabda carinulata TaxID=1163345 RepID=UPI0025A1992B|nr:uncharacterized protein LOC130898546 [Diorhabda carinulata]
MIFPKLIILSFLIGLCRGEIATLVKDLVQFNVAGHPVLHKDQMWPFDPDVGIRRSRQYTELNGYLGEKAIERLGLGIDGFDRERLAAQRIRDAGHLGGVEYNGQDGL